MKKIIYILILFTTIISCSKNNSLIVNKGLELKILNDSILSYDAKAKKTYKNIIYSTITNKTNEKIILLPISPFGFRNGYLSYENVGILNTKNNKEIPLGIGFHFIENDLNNCIDIEMSDFKQELGYKKRKKSNLMYFYENNKIVIHPKETLYFESSLSLPDNTKRNFQRVELNKENQYKLFLSVKIDTAFYKERLTNSTLRTIKENNYKLFHGTITSENSVPIVFKN